MSQWINVKDSLPDHDTQVLVFAVSEGIKTAYYHDNIFTDSRSTYWDNYDVTHWMPLPDAPIK